MATHHKVIIIGSGPAGYTAAVYLARADLKPLMFTGLEPGGQLTFTTEVENFPGFPHGIMGPELMDQMRAQAERFGTTMLPGKVDAVDLSQRPFRVTADDTTYTADALVIATGASANWLEAPGFDKYRGYGITACATCDGAFYRNKRVIVVGGGDSAMEEALTLTKFASEVFVVHRRDSFRASKIMQKRVLEHPKVRVLWNTTIAEYKGDGQALTGVTLKNTVNGDESHFDVDGVFMGIGHTPNTKLFGGALETNEKGYLLVKPGTMNTSVAGVFAAGDVQDWVYRQAITAAGTGCMAALEAERFLAEHE